jgi:dolichol-phosphate mannosyltransferase
MKLSIVVPACNEEENLRVLHARLTRAALDAADSHEIIFVDDGSRDRSLHVVRELAREDPRVRYLSFSRNFGHEIASTAGLDRATGDTVVLIDADLQDPPELIPQMVQRWREGAHVVFAQRRARAGEPLLRRAAAYAFYRAIRLLTDVDIPRDTGDFRLMDRRVVDAFRQCRENPRFVRGLVSWVGFRQVALPYDRDERHAGRSNYSLRTLLRLSFDAATAFSLRPLKLMTWFGALVAVASLVLVLPLMLARARTSFDSAESLLACGLFFMGGVQLVMLGVIAHYLAKVFQHAQGRPMYIVAEESPAPSPPPSPAISVRAGVVSHA